MAVFIDELTIHKKLFFIFIFFILNIVGLASVSYMALYANATVTSYIEGEGYWSKSQRDAVYHLFRYAYSKDPNEFKLYQEYASVPLGDKIARIEVFKPDPDFNISDQGLIQGRNNPNEVRAMALFLVRFQNISYLKRAIQFWTEGDENMEKLDNTASRLHEMIVNNKLDAAKSAQFMAEIDEINTKVRLLEDKFSQSLAEASRALKSLLLGLLVISTLLFSALGLWVAIFISRKILKAIRLIEIGTKEIQAGSLSREIVVISNDELGQLARSFNQMSKSLDERTRELEVQRSNSMYSAKMVALGEMAGGIAHEINTPLLTISLAAGLINEYIDENKFNKEIFLKLTDQIQSVVTRISKIILGMRKFSRDGRSDETTRVSLDSVIQDSISFCQQRFKDRGIKFQVVGEIDGIFIRCRPVEISQVIVNLLNNSFDAIEKMNSKWIEVSIKKEIEAVVISITDSGNGINKEVQNKIFQPFFTTKEVGSGTGLGLSISSGIILSHGGKLEYDKSCLNTCFKIHLPLDM